MNIELPRWARTIETSRKKWMVGGGLALLSLLAWSALPHASGSRDYQAYGHHRDSSVCTKTLLWRFDDRRGFGSEIAMFARAVLFADINGYALVYDDSRWNYGRFSDYFLPRQLDCSLPEDVYSLQRTECGQQAWEASPHLLVHRFTTQDMDRWLARTFIDIPAFFRLPDWTPLEPLAHDLLVPPPLQRAYDALFTVHQTVFQVRPEIAEAIEKLERDYRVGEADRGPIVGLHYRGGDKIGIECTLETNCANVTVYSMAATQALEALRKSTTPAKRPVLALMTVEPGMEEAFRREALVDEHFEVKRLPPSPLAQQGHDEATFLDVPLDVRIEDTKALVRDIIFLSSRADAVIASMRSNIGLLLTQWTPRGHMLPFSIDEYYTPLTWGRMILETIRDEEGL